MNFKPAHNYLYVEEIRTTEEQGNFQWAKQAGDLTPVRVLEGTVDGSESLRGRTAIVITTLIQNFEFNKQQFKIVPTNAIIGFIEE